MAKPAPTIPLAATTTSMPLAPVGLLPVQRPFTTVAHALDLAIALDRTGSSVEFQMGIIRAVEIILGEADKLKLDCRVWVQSHGDEEFGEQVELITDGGSPTQALDDIRRVTFAGGGDLPETHLSAIEHLLDLVPWRSQTGQGTGILLVLATHESKPAASGRSARTIGEDTRQRRVLLHAICQPTPEMCRLVRAASGVLIAISNDPPRQEIEKLAHAASRSIAQSIPRTATVPAPNPR